MRAKDLSCGRVISRSIAELVTMARELIKVGDVSQHQRSRGRPSVSYKTVSLFLKHGQKTCQLLIKRLGYSTRAGAFHATPRLYGMRSTA